MTDDTTGSPFADLDAFVALPRASGLRLSPDGERLVLTVATLDPDRTRYVSALWEVDPAGQRPARRLTRSAKGEAGAAFASDGSVLFTSARPDPESSGDDDLPPALWVLEPGVGEARVLATRPGGVAGPVVARESGAVVVVSDTLPRSGDAADDEERRKARKDTKVSAILHDAYPVRYWDADLGPGFPRLCVAAPPGAAEAPGPAGDERRELRDLTPDAGRALLDADYDVTPDGATVVTTWTVPEPAGSQRTTLVVVDVADGSRTVLADDERYEYASPVVSPDGRMVAASRYRRSSPDDPGDKDLVLLELGTRTREEETVPTGNWDRWPSSARWLPDGGSLVVGADDGGRAPLFRVDVESRQVTRLTGDRGAYTDPQVSPDGRYVYAIRSAVDSPPAPVRLDAAAADQQPTPLPLAVAGVDLHAPSLPGRLTEVRTSAADGHDLRAWLVLPDGAGPAQPAPLLLWIHGGPLGSWNAWSWRWNPWVAAARGYAVLLPDPALSTGYGLDFVRRGWGAWGSAPYTDLMAVTDTAEQRDDIDPTRTAALGGSFGGYMANWVAGHTDRFRAIVTHASLWALDQFGPTTDAAWYWGREMTEEMALEHSPHRHAESIRSPMLVIHGDKDYRVPIGEALRLWWDLARQHEGSTDFPHRFLYFPDENHWILTPQHAVLWYQTVLAFLDQHVLGKDWVHPELLR